MWTIRRHPQDVGRWLGFELVNVLDEYDFPLLFTLTRADGQYHLAYFCGQGDGRMRFLVVPFTTGQEERLLDGQIDLREALTQREVWAVDLDKRWEPVTCWRLRYDALPPNVLPQPGVMLRAGMVPAARPLVSPTITTGAMFALSFDRADRSAGCLVRT